MLADGKCSAWEGLIKWSGADSQLDLKNEMRELVDSREMRFQVVEHG